MSKKKQSNQTVLCLAYDSDLDNIYAFMCARYKDISYEEFLNMGMQEFYKKLGSVPETEPLFNIIKARVIKTSEIKDKEERKYWVKQKRLNKIPEIYLSRNEIDSILKAGLKKGNINGKGFN